MIGPIALATCAEMPVEADETPLDVALARAGLAYSWEVWDDPAVDWSRFAGVLIRTVWDYTEKVDAFRSWTAAVAEQTALWNPAPLVRWNSHKRYLAELGERGVDVVPTLHVAVGDTVDLDELPDGGGAGIIVKPAESVGAIGLTRWTDDATGRAGAVDAVATLHAQGQDVLVQPLMPAIADGGETSVVVLDGTVSHTVRKVPQAGDIRSQPEWGAALTAIEATPAHLELARTSLAAAVDLAGVALDTVVYARVDCVDHDGRPHLMELELIEPDLYVGFDDGAADRVVAAVARRLAG